LVIEQQTVRRAAFTEYFGGCSGRRDAADASAAGEVEIPAAVPCGAFAGVDCGCALGLAGDDACVEADRLPHRQRQEDEYLAVMKHVSDGSVSRYSGVERWSRCRMLPSGSMKKTTLLPLLSMGSPSK
jgi:hypothetical protein